MRSIQLEIDKTFYHILQNRRPSPTQHGTAWFLSFCVVPKKRVKPYLYAKLIMGLINAIH